MEWLVIASVEPMEAAVTINVPGLNKWMEDAGIDRPEEWWQDITPRVNVARCIKFSTAREWIHEPITERLLCIDIFPAHDFPQLEVLEDGIIEWDRANAIDEMIECTSLNHAIEEGKRMRATLDPQFEESDRKDYERRQAYMVKAYEKIRAFVAQEYPHLPPMPETSDVSSKENA